MTAQTGNSSKHVPYLIGLSGSMAGSRIDLISPQSIIGRDPEMCDIALDNNVVSRRHAAIEIDAHGNVIVSDMGSTHGTFVNGSAVTKRTLKEGDTVGFGPLGVVAFAYHCNIDGSGQRGKEVSAQPTFDAISIRD